MKSGRGKRMVIAVMLAGLLLGLEPLIAQEAETSGETTAESPTPAVEPAPEAVESPGAMPRIDPAELESMHLAWVYERDGKRRLVYVVQSGDTLWDIAGKYLNSNYYWPKIWERNTFIVNPHLIFPGDLLYLFPDGVVELPPPELATKDGRVRPVVRYKTTDAWGFVDLKTLEKAGKILGNKTDKELLGENDVVYVNVGKADKIEVGETFHVFRLRPHIKSGKPIEVFHPITGEVAGYQTMVLGEIRITKVLPHSSEGVIQKSYEEIHNEDLITPYMEPVDLVPGEDWISQVTVLPTELEELKAYIITSRDTIKLIGNNDFVYIDKGAEDGVLRGNVFTVYKPCEYVEDKVSKEKIQIPEKIIGHLVVIEPRESTSVALVTDAEHELMIGDISLMSKYNRWEIEGISSTSDLHSCARDERCRIITADEYAAGKDRPFCMPDPTIKEKTVWDMLKPKSRLK